MAIIHEPSNYNRETQRYESTGERVVTYEGRVFSVNSRDYRAMSDVYTFALFATVVSDSGRLEEILVNANFECDLRGGSATVDVTPEWLAIKAKADKEIAEQQAMNLNEKFAKNER